MYQQAPVRRRTSSGAWIWLAIIVVGLLSAAVKGMAHHPVVGAVSAGMVVVLAVVIWSCCLLNRAEKRRDARSVPLVKDPDKPICLHPNAVRVENLLNPDEETWAWLCPPPPGGCNTQLRPDWKPAAAVTAPPAVPVLAGRWEWRWWCTCRKSRMGYQPDQATAQAAIDTGVAAHGRPGHRYQYEWQNVG